MSMAATLCAGLSADSRVMRRLSGLSYSTEALLLAGIYDRLSVLVWQQTKDGRTGRNKPTMIEPLLRNAGNKQKSDIRSFASGKEFEEARERILRQINGD